MNATPASIDIVMLGTFSPWQRGTLQARALPLARELFDMGVQCALVTTPWDMSHSAGEFDVHARIPIINTRAVSPKMAALAVREQLQWVHRLQPRIIHLFKPKGFGGLAAFVARALGQSTAALIVDCDDWEGDGGWNQANAYSFLQQRLFDWQEASLIKRADAVTTASSLLYRRAVDLRGRSGTESVRLIPNALPSGWSRCLSQARQRQPAAVEGRTVVLYSRFAEFPENWLDQYCSALSQLVAEQTNITVIGAWPTQHVVEGSGLVSVDYPGYVARTAIPDLLAGSSVAIYPYSDSLITRSKQSVKLLELMAAGCPLIVSDVGDVARTVGRAGVVTSGDDPVEFAAATAALLDRPEQLADMSQAGRERIRYDLQLNRLAGSLKQLYEEHGLSAR